jgi:hypothetical protein
VRKPRRRYMQQRGMHTGMPTINRSLMGMIGPSLKGLEGHTKRQLGKPRKTNGRNM